MQTRALFYPPAATHAAYERPESGMVSWGSRQRFGTTLLYIGRESAYC
jgi:hypothetical protein